MTAQVQPYEIQLYDQYKVVHQLGQGFNSFTSGLEFVNGEIEGPVFGYVLHNTGLMVATHFFRWEDDHEIVWTEDGADYVPKKPARPAKPEREPEPETEPEQKETKPKPKPKAKRGKRGRR